MVKAMPIAIVMAVTMELGISDDNGTMKWL